MANGTMRLKDILKIDAKESHPLKKWTKVKTTNLAALVNHVRLCLLGSADVAYVTHK